jgi:RNA polymerase sigma-70 factor (ECF subfamily)
MDDNIPERFCMPDLDEQALVGRSIAGDADAFGELYRLHLDAIYRYVYFRVGDANDAEDITEQVFLKAWEALPGYKQYGHHFTSWLYRIAHNMVVDHHRRHPMMPLPATVEGAWECRQADALDQVIDAEESAALSKAIARLPEDQQQLIALRFIEGLDHAEIAQIMNKSQGACRVLQHRALTVLNRLLAGVHGKQTC